MKREYRRVGTREEDGGPGMGSEVIRRKSPSCLLPLILLSILLLISVLISLLFLHPSSPFYHSAINQHSTSQTTPTTKGSTPTSMSTSTSSTPPTNSISTNVSIPTLNDTFLDNMLNEVEEDNKQQGHHTTQDKDKAKNLHLLLLVARAEKFMERFTGMEGELLIPLFVLLCFLTALSIVSLCCCILSKRREARRRHIFGKIMTDLETGEAKTVLLNQSDLDD